MMAWVCSRLASSAPAAQAPPARGCQSSLCPCCLYRMAGVDQDDSLDWLCELLGQPHPPVFALGSAPAPVPLPPPVPAPALAQVPSPLPPPVNDAAALAVEDDSDVEVWLLELTSLPPPPPDADAEAMAWGMASRVNR